MKERDRAADEYLTVRRVVSEMWKTNTKKRFLFPLKSMDTNDWLRISPSERSWS